MNSLLQENQILADAINALEGIANLKVNILPQPRNTPKLKADGLLEITFNGHKERFVVEVKILDRYIAVAQIRAQLDQLIETTYPGHIPLLVTRFATTKMAEECKRLNLPYVDTAGNIYLRTDRILLDIRTNKASQPPLTEYRANRPAGLKITFALLCRPELAGTTYRELAKFANVALGTIGPVLDDLARREFLQKKKANHGALIRREELLKEWALHYPANLRPRLHPRRYQAERKLIERLDLHLYKAYWGGEFAAERITHYLKAEHFLIYTRTITPQLMKTARMRLATNGNVEILQTFWNPELTTPDQTVVPPLLVYADLIATGEPRNLETALEIYERFLKN